MLNDTIVALATPHAVGAIHIIRLSGANAIQIVQKIFRNKNLVHQQSHTIHYGFIYDGKQDIDEVCVSLFHAPKSFTTENVVEISCHGSLYVAEKIIELCVLHGARPATAGEFTQRAFLHGRIDLAQAEAVADLIQAESEAMQTIALNQMRGGFSVELKMLREQLVHFASLIELELDFSEEDVEFADRSKLINLLTTLIEKIQPLIQTFQYGNAIKNGVPVAIIGKPNAGKSSLLNALLNEERAIVSSIAGTTRDTIEENLTINGIQYRLIDTAGIRQTTDEIEQIGVERAYEKAQVAELVLYLLDINGIQFQEVLEQLNKLELPKQKVIVCFTKLDLHQKADFETWINFLKQNDYNETVQFSAVINTHSFLISLKEKISNATTGAIDLQQTIVVNMRHYAALQKAFNSLQEIISSLNSNVYTELIAQEIKQALESLGEITGEVTNDEILGNIFGKFCIGK